MKRHLKRLAAPKTWRLPRKERKWTVKTAPGPHPTHKSLPLLLVVRDFLGHARTGREAKRIIKEGKILVDKRVRKDHKFPVGLMDIIEIPAVKGRWIVLFDSRGKIRLVKSTIKGAKHKLCRIMDKTMVRGGKIQLNLHDGRNILVGPEEDGYKPKDTILLDLKKNKIVGHLPFKEGNKALITGGKHVSRIAEIKEYKVRRSPEPNRVVLEDEDGVFETIEDYVFVVGDDKLAVREVAK
jgi:small subunit ribosomal protein S4e